MATTYEPIATTTLGSAATAITFSSIPATYTDLKIIVSNAKVTATGFAGYLRFNSDSATNYSFVLLGGNGVSPSATSSATRSTLPIMGYITDLSTTIPAMAIIDILSYAGSTNKTTLIEASYDLNGAGATERYVGLWRSTAAINNITVNQTGGTGWAAGTTATLYGIKAA